MSDIKLIDSKSFDEERALYGSDGVKVYNCRFDGPADGESAFKESRNIEAEKCYFNLRYPFWHDDGLRITDCELTENCRAALWYSKNVSIDHTDLHGIKALRECANAELTDCDIISPEFGWYNSGVTMKNTTAAGEYFMMRSDKLDFSGVTLNGKYSFQYIEDSVFENCAFNTKDAFWHAKNVTVRNSTIKGEYLAWYCENVTFENCTIEGTQPLCYCKGLKIVNCTMNGADFSFEKSAVEASLNAPIISIKNPHSGRITAPAADEIILDSPTECEIKIG